MTTLRKPVKCVVLPARPQIDKLVACKRAKLDFEANFHVVVAFCDVNIPSTDDRARWDAVCSREAGHAYLIDVGEKKYHTNASSATEVEKMSSETQCGRTWNFLLEIINENNRTGNLKNSRYSIAKALRDAYEVMTSGSNSQEVVFNHGMDVVDGFFFQLNRRNWDDLFHNPQYEALRKIWEGFNVSEKEVLPFTLPRYFRQLFMSGRSEAEITQKVGWWLDKMELVAKNREIAKKKHYSYRGFSLNFSSSPKSAGLIKIGNTFEAEAASYQLIGSGRLAVGIIRNERGQVHIQSSFKHKGANFGALAEGLQALEPGQWYYETRFNAGPMLMNGSRQFTGVPPTDLSDEDLMHLVRTQVTFGK